MWCTTWSLDRVSSPTLSPDGGRLVFAKCVMNAEATKASTALYQRDLRTRDLRPPTQITPEAAGTSTRRRSRPMARRCTS